MRIRLLPTLLALCATFMPQPTLAASPSPYFTNRLVAGEHFSNVISVMTSYRGAGFTESVRRIAGSFTYVVTSAGPRDAAVNVRWRYDGYATPGSEGQIEHRDPSTLVRFEDGKPEQNIDSTGLAFNPFLWGDPPARPIAGTRWTVAIPKPWELGPAGIQDVQVVSAAPETGTITLERTGYAPGPSEGDKHGAKIAIGGRTVRARIVATGPARWRGFTTIRHGIILADDLLVDRSVDLVVPGGRTYHALQRTIMLCNAIPGDT